MNKSLRKALAILVKNAYNTHCEDLDHIKKHQHGINSFCPAEYELHMQAELVDQYLKELEKPLQRP